MDAFTTCSSPLGRLTLACQGDALAGLWLEGQKYFAAGMTGAAEDPSRPVLQQALRWLNRYFDGDAPFPSELPLEPQGTLFRKAVWLELLTIPYGTVATYGDIARTLSLKTGRIVSPRSVGNAVGHNPISIVIPCHRVIGASGDLTGYAGGLPAKKFLLALEGAGSIG